MIPKLFAANATAFTNNGLGRLPDAVECTVTEERNGPYELYMRYPITGKHYSDIQISRIIYAVPADGKTGQPFRIYRIEKPLNGIVSIYAEHISYELNSIPVMPFTATSCAQALTRMVNYSAQANPFTVWTDKTATGTFSLQEPRSFRALLGGTQGSILDVYGKGEYEFDNHTVKLHLNRGIDSGVVLRYGKNITDLKQDENIETTITGICPYWKDPMTGVSITLPEYAVWSPTADNFPYKRTAVVDFSQDFQEAPTVEQLRTRANQYITDNDIGIPKVSLDVKFVPLWQMGGVSTGNPTRTLMLPATVDGDTLLNLGGTISNNTVTLADAYWDVTFEDYKVLERLHLCDTLTVRYDTLGVDATAKIVKTVYNVLTDRYDSLEVGDARTNLASQMVSVDSALDDLRSQFETERSTLEAYVDHQTELITGGLGGFVVMNLNANGQPEEILIMDTNDMSTAVNVIRMNKNGIGFSNTGYNGPFNSAWTIDGVFNADFIGAGSLDANIIRTGLLTDALGNNSWNLSTGDMVISAKRIKREIKTQYVWTVKHATTGWSGVTMTWANADAASTTFLNNNSSNANSYECIVNYDSCLNHSTGTSNAEYYRSVAVKLDKTDVVSAGTPTSGYMMVEQFCHPNLSGYTYSYTLGFYDLSSSSLVTPDWSLAMNPATNYVHIGKTSFAGSHVSISGGGINIEGYNNSGTKLTGIDVGNYSFKVYGSSATDGSLFSVGLTSAAVNGRTLAFASSSSKRYKHDIDLLGDELDPHKLLELKAKQFVFNDDHEPQYLDMKGKTIPGFIAEDVEEIYPSAVIHDPDTGEVESWDERRIIPGMLALIQEQQKRIDDLEARLARLEKADFK